MAISTFSASQSSGMNFQHLETTLIANVAPGNIGGDVITEDAIIHEIIVTNESGALAKITVQDRAGAGRAFGFAKSTVVGQGNSIMFESMKGSPATGGLNITCDTLSACSVKIVWRRSGGN